MGNTVVVYGATGHTGRFVVAELRERGFGVIVSGRDATRLDAFAAGLGGVEARAAVVDDAEALDRALAGADAVINTAGPFALTGGPVAAAAVRAGIPYVDVAAEIEANADAFAAFGDAPTPVIPAMAFYGGLGDLLVTALLGERTEADEVHVAYGLNGWQPTEGSRVAGAVSMERRGGRRVRFRDGALEYHGDEPVRQNWSFPEPLGEREVVAEFTMADVVTVPSHVRVPQVRTYMTAVAAGDIVNPDTPTPQATDESGRSGQTFIVDVRVRAGGEEYRAIARGRDTYAVTAPLAVEAVTRLLTGRTKRDGGVASAGAMFEAEDFLKALAPHVTVELPA